MPYRGRDLWRVEDVDSRGPDHAADAVRYGCLHEGENFVLIKFGGI